MKLALFDCDGTLVDSAHLIHEVMLRTFRDFDLPLPEAAATRAIIGLTLDVAIARMRGLDAVDSQSQAMMTHYKSLFGLVRAEQGFHEPLYPGIRAMIDDLSGRERVVLGAVTGKSRRGLEMVCQTHGFENTFFVSRTADDCPSKPHPAMVNECCAFAGINPNRTVVIGDSIYDMEMAKAAGALAVGVSWGYCPPDALKAAGADVIAYDAADIVTIVSELD